MGPGELGHAFNPSTVQGQPSLHCESYCHIQKRKSPSMEEENVSVLNTYKLVVMFPMRGIVW